MNAQPQSSMLYSVEAEQQLLGAVLLDNRVYHRCSDIISGEQFYDPVHRRIWEVCAARINAGELITPVILSSIMAAEQGLAELGGAGYLARIAGASIASVAARDYARMLHECWQRRTVLGALEEAQIAINAGAEPSSALNVLTAVSDVMRGSDGKPASVSYLAAITEAVKTLTSPDSDDEGGVTFGVKEWDKTVGRLRRGDMIVVGGRPSMGKTSLALALGIKAADAGVGVAIVSLEMTGESLASRALGEASNVHYERILDRVLSDQEAQRVVEAAYRTQDRPMRIVQPHIKDLHAINASLVRIKNEFEGMGLKLGLVLVDYLQLIRTPGKDTLERVSNASHGLKSLAMQLDVPVVALAQLSRQVESRDNKRPILSDLRDSGSIEQDADTVIFCYRDEYYIERQKPHPTGDERKDGAAMLEWNASMSSSRNKMEIILAKKRQGRIGSTILGCDVATNRIWSLSDDRGPEVDF